MKHSCAMGFPFKAVLFDWANTLVDLGQEDDLLPFRRLLSFMKDQDIFDGNFEPIYQEYQDLFYGMIEISRKTHREACFEQVLGYLLIKYKIKLRGKTRLDDLLKVYYQAIYEPRKLYLDTLPTMSALRSKGIRLGIISNTTNPVFMKDWERRKFGLDEFFELAIYSSAVPYRKPHPSIFELAIHYLKQKADEILFVGDNFKVDIIGAKGVGMATAWLNRNKCKPIDSIHADYQINSLAELIALEQFPIDS